MRKGRRVDQAGVGDNDVLPPRHCDSCQPLINQATTRSKRPSIIQWAERRAHGLVCRKHDSVLIGRSRHRAICIAPLARSRFTGVTVAVWPWQGKVGTNGATTLCRMNFQGYVRHLCTFSCMLTTACWLVCPCGEWRFSACSRDLFGQLIY